MRLITRMGHFVRNADVLFSQVGSDFVALHVARGDCFGMSDVTATVWHLLESPIGFNDLCAHLQSEFVVGEQQCRDDVSDLLEEMASKDLIRQI